jgi:rod shape-determining protein MreC
MPVVNAFGVVGKIAEVSEKTSKVILLTDPQFSVAGLVQEPRESVLVSGTLRGVLRLSYVDENASIKVADKVITSQLSESFPENMMVGEVSEIIQGDHGLSTEYVVKPAVLLSQLEEVLVIVK